MASIANDPNGRRRIIFTDKNRDRKTIWLGKVSKRLAEEIKTKVESINAASIAGCSIDGETAAWIGRLGDELHTKFVVVGLAAPRAPVARQVGLLAFVTSYITGRTDIKPGTRANLETGRAKLVEFFGSDKPIGSITVSDAQAWAMWLKQEQYARGTIGRTIKFAKQFFQAAIDKELLLKSPFAKLKASTEVDETKKFFVTQDMARLVLDACPNHEWRLIFALARLGGIRCPSELLTLTWSDIDWARSRFRVVSPKKEHLDTGSVRMIPLFPELRPFLEEAFDLAPEGVLYVINRYRDTSQNLRTQLQRIIRKAGLTPWPKPFNNLRSSRETELAESFPLHVATAWMGNSERVARKHYLQVQESYFVDAANSAPYSALLPETARQTAQHRARTEHAQNEKTPENPGFLEETAVFSGAPDYSQQDSNLQHPA